MENIQFFECQIVKSVGAAGAAAPHLGHVRPNTLFKKYFNKE